MPSIVPAIRLARAHRLPVDSTARRAGGETVPHQGDPPPGMPEKRTIDGRAAYEAAMKHNNEEHGTAIEIRKIPYRTNRVEQDHRGMQRATRPMLGCKACAVAQDTLVGIALRDMIKTRQRAVEEGDKGLAVAERLYSLAASSSPQTVPLPLHGRLSQIGRAHV